MVGCKIGAPETSPYAMNTIDIQNGLVVICFVVAVFYMIDLAYLHILFRVVSLTPGLQT